MCYFMGNNCLKYIVIRQISSLLFQGETLVVFKHGLGIC